MQIRPGSMYPLGASYDGAGVNFALFSKWHKRSSFVFSMRKTTKLESK